MESDGFPLEYFHWANTSPSLTSLPVPGDMPAPHLRWQIVTKTGIPEMEWAGMYVPVLAVVEGVDERWQTENGLSFRTINRAMIAEKLGLNPCVNFGAQLHNQRVLSGPEAIFLDSDFFRDCDSWKVHLKIDTDDQQDISELVAGVEQSGLIERWWVVQRKGESFYLKVGSSRLTHLLRALDPSSTMLLSLNGAVLYS